MHLKLLYIAQQPKHNLGEYEVATYGDVGE